MRSSAPSAGDVCRVRLGSELTIYTAAAAKDELLPCLDRARQVELDLSAVTDLDTAGLQILMLLKREAAARGVALALSGHSRAVTEVLDLLGLAAWFGDPILITPDEAV